MDCRGIALWWLSLGASPCAVDWSNSSVWSVVLRWAISVLSRFPRLCSAQDSPLRLLDNTFRGAMHEVLRLRIRNARSQLLYPRPSSPKPQCLHPGVPTLRCPKSSRFQMILGSFTWDRALPQCGSCSPAQLHRKRVCAVGQGLG